MRSFLVMRTDFSLKSAADSVMHGVSYMERYHTKPGPD